jgi:hypothetical protein
MNVMANSDRRNPVEVNSLGGQALPMTPPQTKLPVPITSPLTPDANANMAVQQNGRGQLRGFDDKVGKSKENSNLSHTAKVISLSAANDDDSPMAEKEDAHHEVSHDGAPASGVPMSSGSDDRASETKMASIIENCMTKVRNQIAYGEREREDEVNLANGLGNHFSADT